MDYNEATKAVWGMLPTLILWLGWWLLAGRRVATTPQPEGPALDGLAYADRLAADFRADTVRAAIHIGGTSLTRQHVETAAIATARAFADKLAAPPPVPRPRALKAASPTPARPAPAPAPTQTLPAPIALAGGLTEAQKERLTRKRAEMAARTAAKVA